MILFKREVITETKAYFVGLDESYYSEGIKNQHQSINWSGVRGSIQAYEK